MMRGRNPSFWSVIRKTVERMKVRNPGIHNCCTRFFMRCPLSFAAIILRCKSCQSEACSMVRRADSSLPKPCLQNTAYDSSRCAASSAVPRLMPEPIIAFPLTYRNLIYMTAIVNCSDVQGCSWDLPEGQKLNGSRAPRGPLRGNPKNRRFGFCRDGDRRIEHLCQNLDARDQPRSRTRKLPARLERIDPVVLHRPNRVPLVGQSERLVFLARLLPRVAAGGNQQEVRFSFDNILQMNPERRLSGTANRIFPAGASDHLGHPVAADVNGFEPFEKGHARAAPRRIQLSPQDSL